MLPINRILWPTDASRSAIVALDAAVELAEHFGADICALQVINQLPVLAETSFANAPGTVSSFNIALYEQELEQQAQRFLEQIIAEKIPHGIAAETHVILGQAKDTIVDFAERANIDLIVMATSGRSGLARFMIGSVAEATIRQSSIPTLIIPAPGDDENE
jgi:nucleotide-binding universal stress UspA family protein